MSATPCDVAPQRVVITRRAPLEPSRPWFSLARGGGAVAAVRHVPVDLRRARALLAQHRRAVECAHESQTPKSERYRNDQHHVYTRRSLANDCAILVSETVQESRASSNTIRTPFELALLQFCLTVGSTPKSHADPIVVQPEVPVGTQGRAPRVSHR